MQIGQLQETPTDKPGLEVPMPQPVPWFTGGRIAEVLAKKGDSVKKGQALVRVDTMTSAGMVEIAAPEDGKVGWISGAGSVIPVGNPVAIMGQPSSQQLIAQGIRETPVKSVDQTPRGTVAKR